MSPAVAAGAAAGSITAAPACIVCGRGRWVPRFRVLEQCASCGFLRADLEIDDDAIRALYGEAYFRGEEYADYLADREVHRRNFARRHELMVGDAGALDSIFEVGCAYGLWLEYLSERGVANAGVDISSQAVDYARTTLGQDARCGSLLEQDLGTGAFQAFVMWDTIEHLARPQDVLARIAESLPTGGWLFLTTGDAGSRFARLRGASWRMIHPPTHLQYFDRATMERLLERHGLKVERVRSMPIYRNLHSTLANLEVLGRGILPRLAGATTSVIPDALSKRTGFWVDLGDIMFIAARKPRPADR